MLYQQLVLEKVAVERQIRAFRVIRIRKAFAGRIGASTFHLEMEEMESLIASVFYDESKLDFVIEQLEVLLDLDMEDL